MTLQITVRGSAEEHFPAERALLTMSAAIEGPEKDRVLADAVAVQDPLTAHLRELTDMGAVAAWSSDQVRVFSHRPWQGDHQARTAVHTARLRVTAEFSDFERLSGFIDHWSGHEGVEIEGISWDVSAKNRRVHEAEVRKAAVDDAVAKAQAYSDAVRRGRVTARALADPGMLDGSDDAHVLPVSLRDVSDAGVGPSLDLVPEEIVIQVEVDARFSAE